MFKVKIDSKALEVRFAAIANNADAIALETVTKLGSIVKANARRYVPVDTGALKKSIDMEIKDKEAHIGTPLDYGWIQEFGSVNQAPQSFLRPALADAERQAQSVMKEAVNKYVK